MFSRRRLPIGNVTGAPGRVRTRDPLITNHVASLKRKPNFVNNLRSAPIISMTYPSAVNRRGPYFAAEIMLDRHNLIPMCSASPTTPNAKERAHD